MELDAARSALVQEARELLAAMESALLGIESEGSASSDAINAIFRAAHTIKGSAGLFALDSIVSFTHVTESVLDRVRQGKLEMDGPMVSLMLESGDYIGALINAVEHGTENEEPDPVTRASIVERLNLALGTPLGGAVAVSPAPTSTAATTTTQEVELDGPGGRVASDAWHISLRFDEGVLRNGMDPISFIKYLATLGRIAHLHTLTDKVPESGDFDPEACYLGFEIDLESQADRTAIEGTFEFVREDADIQIIPPQAKIAEYIRLIESMPESPQRLGELLVKGGALTEGELELILSRQRNQQASNKPIGTLLVEDQVVPGVVVAAALHKQKATTEKHVQEQRVIKVDVSRLDALINLVGELVISGAGARMLATRRKDAELDEIAQTLGKLVEGIRDAALSLRMVQIGEVFQRFPRVVRDIAKDLGKQVDLVITGAETELDKSMVEKLGDPLMHIVRNSLDHGIETAADRVNAGKPVTATLRLNAFHESGSIVLEVSDDGRGLNRARIRNKAIERGIITDDQVLSDQEICNLVFEAGFSTAEQVTNLSGRGVGMDVVRRNIESLRGEVEMRSVEGEGTTARIRLPLTLAIIDGFQVQVADAIFVIPLDMVVECVDISGQAQHHDIIDLRGEPLPYVRLRQLFELPPTPAHVRENIVVVQFGSQRAGIVVDKLLGELQAVIKPMGKLFRGMRAIGGSTILGDGHVALILDIPQLIKLTSERGSAPSNLLSPLHQRAALPANL